MNTSNPVGWFEIYVHDMERATTFYQTVLNTTLTELPMPSENMGNMVMMAFPMQMEAKGASGALVQMEGMKTGGNSTIVYFSSENCAIEEARIATAGGTVTQVKTGIGQYGFITLALDTEGNIFGIHSMK
jgi:uncharacterized protein